MLQILETCRLVSSAVSLGSCLIVLPDFRHSLHPSPADMPPAECPYYETWDNEFFLTNCMPRPTLVGHHPTRYVLTSFQRTFGRSKTPESSSQRLQSHGIVVDAEFG
jgi:hypothetical protein